MRFFCELGLALGKSLAEVLAMSEAEVSVWLAYQQRRGFPVDREVYGVARAGSYVGAVWGGKATVNDLVPKFTAPVTADDAAGVLAWFKARAKKDGE